MAAAGQRDITQAHQNDPHDHDGQIIPRGQTVRRMADPVPSAIGVIIFGKSPDQLKHPVEIEQRDKHKPDRLGRGGSGVRVLKGPPCGVPEETHRDDFHKIKDRQQSSDPQNDDSVPGQKCRHEDRRQNDDDHQADSNDHKAGLHPIIVSKP